MNWKTFLFPTPGKLALAAFLLLALAPFVQVDQPLMCDFNWWNCNSSHLDTAWLYLLNSGTYYVFTGISAPVLLAGLLISYLASCSFLFLLSKRHKKK